MMGLIQSNTGVYNSSLRKYIQSNLAKQNMHKVTFTYHVPGFIIFNSILTP